MRNRRYIYAGVVIGALILSFAFGALIIPPLVSGRWKNISGNTVSPTPPPDLTGEWRQKDSENSDYYQIASIHDGVIEVYWYTPSDDSRDLYWYGSYIPPENGKDKTYTWDSENYLETLKNWTLLRFALRDETKPFTYQKKDGLLVYNVYYGHIKVAASLERVSGTVETS